MQKKEYIERGALIEMMFPIGMPNDGAYPINAKAVRVAIEKAPAADVVEVTRCEKCKYAEMLVDIIGDPHLYCKERNFREVDFDDFCSHAQRREHT